MLDPFGAMMKELEDEEALLPLVQELGFSLEIPENHNNVRRYTKGEVSIWPVREGWQCADLLPCADAPHVKQYINHRQYNDLETALRTESEKYDSKARGCLRIKSSDGGLNGVVFVEGIEELVKRLQPHYAQGIVYEPAVGGGWWVAFNSGRRICLVEYIEVIEL